MKYPGRLIQFFTYVEVGRGPPEGKPEKFLFSKLIYLLKTQNSLLKTPHPPVVPNIVLSYSLLSPMQVSQIGNTFPFPPVLGRVGKGNKDLGY